MESKIDHLFQFVQTYYGGNADHLKNDLYEIIFYLHYVDTESVSKQQVQNSCALLKDFCEVLK